MLHSSISSSSLQGKVALVTGAASGIGQATAQCLAQAGANVMIADQDGAAGEQAAAMIQEQVGSKIQFIHTDVSQTDSTRAAVQATVSAFGRLDIAVNNAGLPCDTTPIANLQEAQWNRIVAVNLGGVAFALKWELQQMIAQGHGGTIINMASATVYRAQPGMAAYVAAKHGIIGLTQTAALENGRHGIRINSLAPGGVATPLTMTTLQAIGRTEEQEASRTSLFGRFARLEEVAQAVLWLASDTSSYMTGAVLPLDGGMSVL